MSDLVERLNEAVRALKDAAWSDAPNDWIKADELVDALSARITALETALAEARNAAFEEAAKACEAHMSQCLEDRDIQKRWPQIKARNAVYAQAIRDMKAASAPLLDMPGNGKED